MGACVVLSMTGLSIAGVLATCVGAAEAKGRLPIFSGEPRLVIVNGYSTSFHWPKMLERKLDRYGGGKSPITVRPATRGGTPIARWIDVETGEPRPPWLQTLRPAIQAKGDRPAIVLCQQSLQWVFGERTAGIRSRDDGERIKQGADALEKYIRLILNDGADLAIVAMHIYKHPQEPEIGNERLALAELMTRKIPKVLAGPDVWEPTSKLYPKAFAGDKLHPNSIGAEIMAQLWFETLLKLDGLDVPAWSRQEMADAIAKGPVALKRGARGTRPPRR